MQFEFNNQLVPQSLVEVEEVGQFALEGMNDEGYFYYMVVKTTLGLCTIATCGPIVPDVILIPDGFKMTLDKIPFKEDKLQKIINFFLNDKNKKLTTAKVITIEEAANQFRDLKDYILNVNEDIY